MNAVMQIAAKRVLKNQAPKLWNTTNPYEEEYEAVDKHGRKTGRTKKRKRGYPSQLNAHDARILKKVRSKAYKLDMSLFNCCGIRFGWSSVVGIVPILGDILDCIMAYLLVRKCEQISGGLPASLQARMMFNVAVDFGIGLIPIVGDLADAVYRANTRNAWLLEEYLVKKMELEHGQASTEGHSRPQVESAASPAKPLRTKSRPFFGWGGLKRTDEEMGVTPEADGGQSQGVVDAAPGRQNGSRRQR